MSGPTDYDIRATTEQALMALRADAARAIKAGDRGLALEAARGYRQLYSSSVQYGSELQERIRTAMEANRREVVQVLGTSAWDEPEPPPVLPPLPAAPGSEPPPLTDEELDVMDGIVSQWAGFYGRHPSADRGGLLYGLRLIDHGIAGRLVAEVRRLRAKTTCDCGKPRTRGACTGSCDRDESDGRPEPLTDEELDEIMRKRREALGWANDAGTIIPGEPDSDGGSSDDAVYDLVYEPHIPRLVAEVRRLRVRDYDQVLDDIGLLLEALGKPNVARPDSPQAVMRECIEEVKSLREGHARLRAAVASSSTDEENRLKSVLPEIGEALLMVKRVADDNLDKPDFWLAALKDCRGEAERGIEMLQDLMAGEATPNAWLERAAEEISKTVGGIEGWRNSEKIEAILRRHRDGKA